MSDTISISNALKNITGTIELPGSKSESNRALIINALSGTKSKLRNISEATDTKVLQAALNSGEEIININDSGTAMRFLLAYFAVTNQKKILTGTPRMCERPVSPLADSLIKMGADIEYLNIKGFPPLKTNGFNSGSGKNIIIIPGNISSQFISALLMTAPILPAGLQIEIEGEIFSLPYVEMTIQIMRKFGVECIREKNIINVERQKYISTEYYTESDWSSASYWYSMAALANDPAIFLKGLKRESLQGDSVIKDMMKPFGVITEFSDTGAFITKGAEDLTRLPPVIDFKNNPDIAQTMIVLCAVKEAECKFTGMESLRIKETDRIQALTNELEKFGVALREESKGKFGISGKFNFNASPKINTCNDHRMAMAFAMTAMRCGEIKISNPDCVGKSYPEFWKDLGSVGFVTTQPMKK